MDASMVSRMKELEVENWRLKKMYAESQMSADTLKEALAKKRVRPSQRREMAKWAVEARGASIRQVCADFMISQTCYRHQPTSGDVAPHRLSSGLHIVCAKLNAQRAADIYGVCSKMLTYRLGVTGAHKRVSRFKKR